MRRAVYSKEQDIIRDIRTRVFVLEQKVEPEEDFDGLDGSAMHVLAYADGTPAGTARMLELESGMGKIGRMAVLKKYRGKGVGSRMAEFLVKVAKAMGMKGVEADAQLQAFGFYEGLGFSAEGPIFLDARIEHRKMRLRF